MFHFITYSTFESESVDEAFLLGIAGKRSKYLPSFLKWTTVDLEDGKETTEHMFNYKMDGNYITEMTITEKTGEEETITIKIFYEE